MDNSILWIWCIVSTIANMVFYYLFWRAIKENEKLVDELAKLMFKNMNLKAEAALKERENND